MREDSGENDQLAGDAATESSCLPETFPAVTGLNWVSVDVTETPLKPVTSTLPPSPAPSLPAPAAAPFPAFTWRFYPAPVPAEIDYVRDFISEQQPRDSPREGLGVLVASKRASAGATAEVLLSVAEDIQHRLAATGGLDAAENYIKRGRHNNENFYEQDDEFIDDEVAGVNLQQLVSRFEDFFCFRGSKEEFEQSELMGERAGELERAQGKRAGKKGASSARRSPKIAKKPPRPKKEPARKVAKPRRVPLPDRSVSGSIQLRRNADGVFTVVSAPLRRRKQQLGKERLLRKSKRAFPAAEEPRALNE